MSFFGALAGAVVGGVAGAIGAVAAEAALHQLHKQSGAPPAHAIQCGRQNDSGAYWAAVAHTQWGEIPCKARGGEAWFGIDWKEHATTNFSYIVVPTGWHLERHQGHIPANALKVGFETSGGGVRYSVVAHTEWGEIPGKSNGRECWFPYGGKEMSTNNFSWICANPAQVQPTYQPAYQPTYQPAPVSVTQYQPSVSSISVSQVVLHQLHRQTGHHPAHAIECGRQRENALGAGPYWTAVAHTEWGEIPCKARGGEAWFCYWGREHSTNNFSYVVVPTGWHLERHQGSIPANALKVGFEKNGGGPRYAVVAHTEHGEIPAKSNGTECWYPYGGKEISTNNWSWVCANPPQVQQTYYQPPPPPATTYAPPPTTYYAPPPSYAAPPVSYAPQPVSYAAPPTSYSAPPATIIIEQSRSPPATVIIEGGGGGRGRGHHHHHQHYEHHHERRW